MRIATKAEFMALSESGRLGNFIPSWPSVEAALADGCRDEVMIRSRVPDSPHMRPHVPILQAQATIDSLVADHGARREDLYLTWMGNPACVNRLLNAEVWRSPQGLYVHWSRQQTHLREAQALDGRHSTGTEALLVLRSALCPNSQDDLWALLDLYPDAMVELTAYDRPVGVLPHRNTVIWEIRNY